MKKEIYTKIILIVIVMFNLFLIYKYINLKEYFNNKIKNSTEKERAYKSNFQRDLELLSQNIYINKDSIFDGIGLFKPKLIFVYSGNECEKCIFENIEKIKEVFGEKIDSNLIILPVHEDSRDIRIALEANFSGLNYKRQSPNAVQVPELNNSSPLFFAVILPDGNITLPYFPDSGNDIRTDTYLKFVLEKYF